MRRIATLAAIMLLGCGGEGDSCRQAGDCRGELVCIGPDEFHGCGIPAQEECSSDADCGIGAVCHAVFDACSPDGVGSRCDAPCAAGSLSCGTGFTCMDGGGGEGACAAVTCAAGFECSWWEACEADAIPPAAPVHARHHGCAVVECTGDAGCPADAACVNDACQSGTGTCGEVVVIP